MLMFELQELHELLIFLYVFTYIELYVRCYVLDDVSLNDVIYMRIHY